MGAFSAAFNDMIKAVAAREVDLKSSISVLMTVLENIPDTVIVLRGAETLFENRNAKIQRLELQRHRGGNVFSHCEKLAQTGERRGLRPPVTYYDPDAKRYFQIIEAELDWSDSKPASLFSITDITDKKRIEELLRREAELDALTGIGNRKHAVRILNDAISQEMFPIALAFVDLDGLKRINDTFGHKAGDDYINAFVAGMTERLDRSKLLTRIGGDEFLVMMRRTAVPQAEALFGLVISSFDIDRNKGKPNVPEFSYGLIEINRGDLRTVDQMIEAADELMYIEKEKHKAARKAAGDTYVDDRL
jgi:diguanylate cyclase (GGDEF)-like protein